MKSLTYKLLLLIVGFILGALCIIIFSNRTLDIFFESPLNNNKEEIVPLYWVAPMDPNFKRDKPGLSPMGMELIPVYAETNTNENANSNIPSDVGVVLLTPEVSNNISVKIEPVAFKPWQQNLESFGTFEYNEEEIHHLHSKVSGWIEKLYVKAQGQKVNNGEALYSFYSPELVNAQEELLQSLRANDKRLIYAAQEKLAALGVPLQSIKSVVKTQKVQRNITYYAQVDGFVKSLMVRHGFYVQPESNIMSIAPLNTIWLMAEVFESQLNQIQENDPVSIKTEAYPNTNIVGKVDYIYPSLQLPSRTVKVRIRVNNPLLNLKPNMFAYVNFTKKDNKNTIIVPLNSVIRTGKSDRVVLVKGSGKYQSIAVTLGRSNSHYIEITSGLTETDSIVSSAQFLIDSQSNVEREIARMNANVTQHNTRHHH